MTAFHPHGSSFKLMAVCCSSCGSVVGVTDYYNLGTLVHKIAKALNIKVD